MNNIITVKVGESRKKAYLQNGFYNQSLVFSPLHSHNYPEIHVVLSGSECILAGGKEYDLKAGDMLMIPPKMFHWIMSASEDVGRIAFQIEHFSEKTALKRFPPQALSELPAEIGLARKNNDYRVVSAYLSLICAKFMDSEKETTTPISDYAFLIYEFFSNRYNEEVGLCDLARELHLSEKQTQRLVKKHMGKTFGNIITERRMAMAKELFENSDFSKREVCEKVGYQSYGGFRKAYKKYESENGTL